MDDELHLHYVGFQETPFQSYHIYITSSEEVKCGDWVINTYRNAVGIAIVDGDPTHLKIVAASRDLDGTNLLTDEEIKQFIYKYNSSLTKL